MADDITLNAGSGGATLATDEISGPRHVQYVKLMNGTADAADVIAGEATNGLDVDVTRLPADQALTDNITSNGDSVVLDIGRGEASAGVQITGTWSATLEFQATLDDTNWFTIFAHNGTDKASSTTSNGNFLLGVGGYSQVRVIATAFGSGTAVVTIIAGRGSQSVVLVLPLPAGTNSIGEVTANAGTNLNTSALAVESGGNLDSIATALAGTLTVDGSGSTQPISGTVTANAGTGTFTVDGSGVTQPVSAASLPLPSGAATAAKQPALGTAGTPSADVISIQGVASGTVVPVSDGGGALTVDGTVGVSGTVTVDGSGVTQPVSGTVTANAGTNLNTSALALESGGNLAGAATSLAIIDDWDETNRAAVNTIAGQVGVQGGSGTVTALTQRVVLATDVALPAGTNAIGKLSANSGVDIGDVDVTSLPALPAGTNEIGSVGVKAVTPYSFGALSTTVQTVKSGAGTLESYYIYNPNTSVAYVQIFDISGTVTLGTSTPTWSIGIPASSGANLSRLGLTFANAIKIAATTTRAGNSAPSTGLDVNFGYI